ncbi:MAG TPA: helix-hairpin-helix domain-containing protein [Desulfocapsa sulfexigens]|nr:helix-hairpin-helix domain-containing protein [Desulfocapsa sulfexigens]
MIGVTQKVTDFSTHPKEGTGVERVVLFFCVLFFVVQIFSGFSLSNAATRQKSQLRILPENVLSVSFIADSEENHDLNRLELIDSQDTFHFAPFFFQPIPINFCNKSLLMSLRGIGPGLAESILKTRDTIGGFSRPEDLLKINGIGPAKMKKFKSYFSFSKDHDQK